MAQKGNTTVIGGAALSDPSERVVATIATRTKDHQLELALASFELKPLHILYLAAIFEGDFDNRLHKGHFALAPVFSQRIGELLNMGLIKYDGRHSITPRGVAHMEQLCAVRVKP